MNRNRIINEILSEVPDEIKNMGEDRKSKLIKARYLYLQLCRKCHYDAEYNIASVDEKTKKFNSSKEDFNNAYDIGLCNDFSIIGKKIFKRMGISAIAMDVDKNEYDEDEEMENPLHVYFMFTLDERDANGNLKFYLADPAFDLKRIQIGCATKYFASRPTTIKNTKGYDDKLSTLTFGEIKEIDKMLGYCNFEYTDEIVRDIVANNSSTKNNEMPEFERTVFMVEKVLKDLQERIFNKFDNIGISDRQSAYKMIFHQVFPAEMDGHLIDFEIHSNSKNKLISTLTIRLNGHKKQYVYDNDGYVEETKLENR